MPFSYAISTGVLLTARVISSTFTGIKFCCGRSNKRAKKMVFMNVRLHGFNGLESKNASHYGFGERRDGPVESGHAASVWRRALRGDCRDCFMVRSSAAGAAGATFGGYCSAPRCFLDYRGPSACDHGTPG